MKGHAHLHEWPEQNRRVTIPMLCMEWTGRTSSSIRRWIIEFGGVEGAYQHHLRGGAPSSAKVWDNGLTVHQMAELKGCSLNAMRSALKKYGLEEGFRRGGTGTSHNRSATKKSGLDQGASREVLVTCKCPTCKRSHEKIMWWTGTPAVPWKFCPRCVNKEDSGGSSTYGGVNLKVGELGIKHLIGMGAR